MYSCRLDQEEHSKLHIIDPFDVVVKVKSFTKLFDDKRMHSNSVDVQVELDHLLSARFSYRDFLLFTSITRLVAESGRVGSSLVLLEPDDGGHRNNVCFLMSMGFSASASTQMLDRCQGSRELAAFMLCRDYFKKWEQQNVSIAAFASAHAKGDLSHPTALRFSGHDEDEVRPVFRYISHLLMNVTIP